MYIQKLLDQNVISVVNSFKIKLLRDYKNTYNINNSTDFLNFLASSIIVSGQQIPIKSTNRFLVLFHDNPIWLTYSLFCTFFQLSHAYLLNPEKPEVPGSDIDQYHIFATIHRLRSYFPDKNLIQHCGQKLYKLNPGSSKLIIDYEYLKSFDSVLVSIPSSKHCHNIIN